MAVILKIQSAPEEFIEHADSWVQPPREQDSLSEQRSNVAEFIGQFFIVKNDGCYFSSTLLFEHF